MHIPITKQNLRNFEKYKFTVVLRIIPLKNVTIPGQSENSGGLIFGSLRKIDLDGQQKSRNIKNLYFSILDISMN